MSWKDKVWEFLRDEPIYAQAKCDPYAEGWKFAFDQQTAKLKVAEKRLNLLGKLANGIAAANLNPQYGRDIQTILDMTEEELDEDYGDDGRPVPTRNLQFVPGDEVKLSIVSQYFREFDGLKGVITYGPDSDSNPGWIVATTAGSIRCNADELTMITRREDR